MTVMPASEFMDLLEERDALRTAIALALPVVKAHIPELHEHLMAFAAVQTATHPARSSADDCAKP